MPRGVKKEIVYSGKALKLHEKILKMESDLKAAKEEMNLPGASPQVLCSAPTSPLTALAFYTCICKCKSGVSKLPCLSIYI